MNKYYLTAKKITKLTLVAVLVYNAIAVWLDSLLDVSPKELAVCKLDIHAFFKTDKCRERYKNLKWHISCDGAIDGRIGFDPISPPKNVSDWWISFDQWPELEPMDVFCMRGSNSIYSMILNEGNSIIAWIDYNAYNNDRYKFPDGDKGVNTAYQEPGAWTYRSLYATEERAYCYDHDQTNCGYWKYMARYGKYLLIVKLEYGRGYSPSGKSNANTFQQIVAIFDHHVGHRLWQARMEDYNRSPWWRKILLTVFGLAPD